MTAVNHGRYLCAKYLIDFGANINFKNKSNMTLLYLASANGYTDICELLIHNGANINAQSKAGKSPLFIACDQGWFDVAKILVNNGANIRLKSSRGKSCIYVAAEKGFKDIVQLLLSKSKISDLFTITKYGTTPFFIASKQMDKSIKLLFKKFCLQNQKRKSKKINSETMNTTNDSEYNMSITSQSSIQQAVVESQKWLREKERAHSARRSNIRVIINRPISSDYENGNKRRDRFMNNSSIYNNDSTYPNRYEKITKDIKQLKSITAHQMFSRSNSDNCIVTHDFYTERLPTPLFAHEYSDFTDAHSEQIHYKKKSNVFNFNNYTGGITNVAGKRKTLKNRNKSVQHRYYQSKIKGKKKKKRKSLWR
eukprot:43799_1